MSKFQTKARAIELLGRKQIRDSITALAELMKNSYDADASWLRVEFHTKSPKRLIIADSGCGMSKNDIETKWLTLGTNSKISNKTRLTADGRPLMGEKGIGRLAASRLGKQLWMLTKTSKTNWNIIFINWDVFENPHIFLDDIVIPAIYNVRENELIMSFDTIIKQLVAEQMKNLDLIGWYETDNDGIVFKDLYNERIVREDVSKLYKAIVNDVNATTLTANEMRKYLSSFEHGTVLYIDALNDNWGRYLAPRSAAMRSDDEIVQKYYNRFATFISTFRHPKINTIPFGVEVYIDGSVWDMDSSYTKEDYQIYDIKIAGYVNNGVFYGELDALNAEPNLVKKSNEFLKNGIDVTSGISNWEEIDCGKYTITLCSIEGELNRSGLNKDDYGRIRQKLDITCGVLVFRDGVRVLPYGEPENDFLSIEKRRSERAGRYIFSHRNIFGRVDINSTDNPHLEDKSSREGFIENDQYFYFVKTLENLLMEIAVNYLSTVRKDSLGIQNSFVERNKEAAAAKKRAATFEKAELAEANQLIREAKNTISAVRKSISIIESQCNVFCADCKQLVKEVSPEDGYNAILMKWDTLNVKHGDLISYLNGMEKSLTIEIPERYAHYFPDELKKTILDYNESMKLAINSLIDDVDVEHQNSTQQLRNMAVAWEDAARASVLTDPYKYKELIEDRIVHTIKTSRERIASLIEFVDDTGDEINGNLSDVRKFIETVGVYKNGLLKSESYLSTQKMVDAFSDNIKELNDIFTGDPNELYERGNNIRIRLENESQIMYNKIESLRLTSVTELGELRKQAGVYAACANETSLASEQVIGLLRQENVRLQAENDIYGDLANLGLAAEIVNHEFNQMFSNVNNSIRNLIPYITGNSAKYWLSQIQAGFRAISDRQNQLSPMYRSYSLRKQEINLKEFIDGVCRFMENVFKRDGIVIDNQVKSSVTLIVSPSKLFPVLSNIINNASYWVLSKNEKIIRFRYDEEKMALYIEDSGTGITAFDKESIFEPFVSYKPNGRGLGLAIVRKVLDSQGYAISIDDSDKTLPGACFRINFTDTEVK